jgi:hypothetical protein
LRATLNEAGDTSSRLPSGMEAKRGEDSPSSFEVGEGVRESTRRRGERGPAVSVEGRGESREGWEGERGVAMDGRGESSGAVESRVTSEGLMIDLAAGSGEVSMWTSCHPWAVFCQSKVSKAIAI